MWITLLKSKIHRAVVTGASIDYEGSLGISADLAQRANLLPYERILVSNMNNGNRFETYVIYSSCLGIIELNGAAALLGAVGDRLTIMSFAQVEQNKVSHYKPSIVLVDKKNQVVRMN